LAKVHAFAADGESDVDAVIDEERDVVPFACCMNFLGCGDQDACVGYLVAVLDYGDT